MINQSLRLPDTISMEPFQQYLAETFPRDSKRSTSGVVHELDSTVNAYNRFATYIHVIFTLEKEIVVSLT